MPETATDTATIRSYPKDDHIQQLKYALSKQVPDMSRGFTITTCYGEINIDPEYAEPFRNLAFEVLQYQLNRHMTRSTDESANCILPSTIS